MGLLFRERPKAQPEGGFRRSPGLRLRPLVYKASDFTTAPRRLLLYWSYPTRSYTNRILAEQVFYVHQCFHLRKVRRTKQGKTNYFYFFVVSKLNY